MLGSSKVWRSLPAPELPPPPHPENKGRDEIMPDFPSSTSGHSYGMLVTNHCYLWQGLAAWMPAEAY